MPFTPIVALAALNGADGFRVHGAAASDLAGFSVASAGDVNGDGIADLIVGAKYADPNGASSGASYVVFGRDTGNVGDFLSSLNLGALDGTDGFAINGAAVQDYAGWSVAGAGDLNGDGIGDLIIGAFGADLNGDRSGAAYVVFGHATAFSASLELSALDGTNGFRLAGETADDKSGWSVASAGDVNGDGLSDLIVGAYAAGAGYSYTGASYVVFGRFGGFDADLDLAALDGTDGFRFDGVADLDLSGMSVASAGDVNGDGLGDLIIGAVGIDANGGAPGGFLGGAYVVFGLAGGFSPTLSLSGLDGTDGFRLAGAAAYDQAGESVASAGDVNGDGYDDVVVGARYADPNGQTSGSTYVVFGKSGGFAANLSLAGLDGTNGFRIDGGAAQDRTGICVAGAGDINGDGLDDLIIGADGVVGVGAGYVVFGRESGFAAVLQLTALDGTNGFRMDGVDSASTTGRSVAGAGDVNGDGVDDLIVGSPKATGGGFQDGVAYVLFGEQAAAVDFTGTGADETAGGGQGTDVLQGMAGKDILSGLGGADVIDGGADNDVLYGGTGGDVLIGRQGNDWLQGDGGDDELNGGEGADKLFGGAGSDLLFGGVGGNDRIEGGDGRDTLIGLDGNDHLDGGLGGDVMEGGAGNDVYLVDHLGDVVREDPGEGQDIVRAFLSWTLGTDLEALQLQDGGDFDGTGNAGANNIQGNGGNNTLSGLAGVDTLNGNDGDDVIVGGLGSDLLRGGMGADVFVVDHAFGTVLETDQVYDFSEAEGDILDLSGAYAGTLDRVRAFTKTAGEMTLTFAGGVTTVKLDVTGDGKVDYQMKINGDVTRDSGDWVL